MKKYRLTLLNRKFDTIYTLMGSLEELAAETFLGYDLIQKAAKYKIWYMTSENTFLEVLEIKNVKI